MTEQRNETALTRSTPFETLERPRLRVLSERSPFGDFGPCCHLDCGERATTIQKVAIGKRAATIYVCEEHRLA